VLLSAQVFRMPACIAYRASLIKVVTQGVECCCCCCCCCCLLSSFLPSRFAAYTKGGLLSSLDATITTLDVLSPPHVITLLLRSLRSVIERLGTSPSLISSFFVSWRHPCVFLFAFLTPFYHCSSCVLCVRV
jgi:hypothetical protein